MRTTASGFRRLALSSQGLTVARPFGSGANAVQRCIEHIGYVQIDTISVVERAHHHVLWSRVPNYKPQILDQLIEQKRVFEYWSHAAAFLPMQHYRFALPRMHAIKSGKKHWFANTSRKLMNEVYRRIENEGPLMARDFQDGVARKGGWWEWKPAKQALEQLFMEGDLMVVGRQGFQKRYDIAERALPSHIDTSVPSLTEYAQHLIDTTIQAHGFAHLRSISYLRKGAELRAAIRQCLQTSIEAGQLIEATLPSGEPVYVRPDAFDKTVRTDAKVRLLSPFDNAVIQRERCRSVFDFDYQIECYVPAPKRQYGYFCLPVLYRDQLWGRMDCKADRKCGELKILSLTLDTDQHKRTAQLDAMLPELAAAIQRFKLFNQCDSVVVEKVAPRSLLKPLRNLLSECCV